MLRTLLAACLGGMACAPVQAQDTHAADEIVVTATRTAQTADETLAAVTVITRQDIERRQAQSLPEALTGLPGLGLANSGGAGKVTSLYLRGTESDHVVVLIDGVRIGSATTGAAAIQDLPIEAVERIEIVRGPLSSLYGSEAIGGVIQIFTRRGGGALAPYASLGVGRYGTQQAAAGISGGGAQSWFNLAASHYRTSGFSARRTGEADADGYRNDAVNLRAGHRFAPGTELDAHLLGAWGRSEFDGSVQDESESAQLALGLALRHRFGERWYARLSLGQGRDESDNYKDGVYRSSFDTRRTTLAWLNDLQLGADRLLTLGLDRQQDRVAGSTAYAVNERDRTGVFAQFQAGAGAHDFKLSLRRDDDSQFGAATTGNAAWGMALGGGLRTRLAYGTAYKAPTFNELYYPGFGNPALGPERSSSLEAGLSGRYGGGRWELAAYETRVDDLIGYDASYTPVNIDRARLRGVEAAAAWRVGGWDAALNATWQDPENRASGAHRGNLLPRRAERSLRLDVERALGAWSLGGSLRLEGHRYDDLANTTRLDGYALVDLRAEYRPARAWRLQARLENLFDRDYETAATYNQPGRGLYLTLRWQPEAR